jgi:two-component system cell cycle sensor histidine kinase/response regulator CckA
LSILRIQEAIKATLKHDVPYHIQPGLRKEPGWEWIREGFTAVERDADGTPVRFAGTAQDITERKERGKALQESQALYHDLVETAQDLIWQCDAEGRYVFLNSAWEDVFGYRIDEMLGRKFTDFQDAEVAAKDMETFRRLLKGGMVRGYESVHRAKDGREIHLVFSAKHVRDERGNVVGARGTAHDITARKKAEQTLRESEMLLRQSQSVARIGHYVFDIPAGTWSSSDMLDEIFGIGPDYVRTVEGWLNIVHPDHREDILDYLETHVLRDGNTFDREYRIIRVSDGTSFWVHGLGSLEFANNGLPRRMFGTIQDITERKKADEALRQSEQFLRGIHDAVDEGFIVVDRNFRILSANNAYCNQTGKAISEIIGKPCFEVSHHAMVPCFEAGEDCAVRSVFNTGEPRTVRHQHDDGSGNNFYVETKAFPLKNASGEVTAAIEVIHNVTERHLLEAEQLKTQKLEAIGTLAGGIAHDFNNLLQGVFGYVSMARLSVNNPAKVEEMLNEAENALSLCVNLTKQLLTFAKGGKPVKETLAVGPVIEKATRFALSGSRCDFRLNLALDLWPAEADEGQIFQVIQNIVLNASEAMPESKTVEISAENMELPANTHPALPEGGRFVRISFRDTGVGIPERYLPRIFDPYFTTKQKGSGLGLATSYSIVKNHGGTIEVQSEQNAGTTFDILFPASASRIIETEQTQGPKTTAKRRAKVLLMDDEEMVRDVAQNLFDALGHEIVLTGHGAEAIEKYREACSAGLPFDFCILDLTVKGGMGGLETLQQLKAIDPEVKAVVSSGYSDDPVVSDYPAYGFSFSLSKPYRLSDLTACLHALVK